MRHNLGIDIADFGFGFLEKLHQPIFLINRLGRIARMNEAGRKLIRIAKSKPGEIESLINDRLLKLFQGAKNAKQYERISFGTKGHQIVARNLTGSEFILVEILK